MKQKDRLVNLPVEAESMLREVFYTIDMDLDGTIDLRELAKAVLEKPKIAQLFEIEDPTQEAIKVFFEFVDTDCSRGISWEELKSWYWKVLCAIQGRKLEATLPPDPSWLGTGGQRQPDVPLRRISNDDLQEAALRGDVGLVRRLVQAGASVNAPIMPLCEDEIMTLLHILASKPELPNSVRIMMEILHRKADVDARSSMGTSALIYACQHKHLGAVEVLLKHHADTDVEDDLGCTAARAAIIPREFFSGTAEPDGSYHDQQWEQNACEIIQTLSRWGADLSAGGLHELPPMKEAVLADNEAVVGTLLGCGAVAVGLHEAVESSSLPIITQLVNAEANPFLRDSKGRDVMELALGRANHDILDACRNYIGKLEREQHPHLKTLEMLKKQDAAQAHSNRTPGSELLTLTSAHANLTKWKRTQRMCARISKNRYYTVFMLFVLSLALFLPDMFVVFQSTNYEVLDWILVAIILLFLFELLFQSVGLWRTYGLTFFFWMDLVGILSVPLDHSQIGGYMLSSIGSAEGVDNAAIVRATRLARLGARAGRFTKLVKLLKFLPGMSHPEHKGAGMAKNVAAKINSLLSTRVACLVIFMVILLPLFDFFRYPTHDFSMHAWAEMLDEAAKNAPNSVVDVVTQMEGFYSSSGLTIFPYKVFYAFSNGTNRTLRLAADEPVRLKQDSVEYNFGDAILTFNFEFPSQVEAILNMAMIASISILMAAAALLVSNAVQTIVLQPLESLLMTVKQIAGKIFSSIDKMAKKMDRKGGDKEYEMQGEDETLAQETVLLDKVVAKLQALSEIAMTKKTIDPDTFKSMGEEDRAFLDLWTSQQDIPRDYETERESCDDEDDGPLLARINTLLAESEISLDQMRGWDYNVVPLSDKHRHVMSLVILMLHAPSRGRLAVGTPVRRQERSSTSSTHASHADGFTLLDMYSSFVGAVAASYRDPKQVPYHNWLHAVDVTFTLHKIFELCSAETFLNTNERFALIVAALCHDIGHPGRNNPFLVETSHELALRYNDASPSEHMHAAKVFEIVGQERTAIFSNLGTAQTKDCRYIIIEAILSTDSSKHFGMVSELQLLCGDNKLLLERGVEENSMSASSLWPSREAVDFIKAADHKKFFRNLLLRFSDSSNPMKPWAMCKFWARNIVEEFFQQGDLEKQLGIPVQPLNDREKVSEAYSQIGYIEFFVAPLVGDTGMVFPPLIFCEASMLDNLQKWFSEWISNDKPDDEEKDRMQERVKKLREGAKHKILDKDHDRERRQQLPLRHLQSKPSCGSGWDSEALPHPHSPTGSGRDN